MLYSFEDYIQEQLQESKRGLITAKYMRLARKSYTCEVCGYEIPKGDYYWEYKPLPNNRFWYSWRKRCIDHEPKRYEEVTYYEDHHSPIKQIRIRNDFKRSVIHG